MVSYISQVDEDEQGKLPKAKTRKIIFLLVGVSLIVLLLVIIDKFISKDDLDENNLEENKTIQVEDTSTKSFSCLTHDRIRVSEFGGGSALLVALAAKAYGKNPPRNQSEYLLRSEDSVLKIFEKTSEILGMDYYKFNNPPPESKCLTKAHESKFCNMINYPVSQTVLGQSNCRDFRAESQYYDLLENSEISVLKTLSQTYSVCDNAIRNSLCLSAFPECSSNNHTTCVTLCNEINRCAASAGLGEMHIFHCPLFCELTIEKENPCFYRYYSECIYYEPECRDSYFQNGWTTDEVSDRFQGIGETNSQGRCILGGKYHYRCCKQSPTAQDFMQIFNRALRTQTPSKSITPSNTPSPATPSQTPSPSSTPCNGLYFYYSSTVYCQNLLNYYYFSHDVCDDSVSIFPFFNGNEVENIKSQKLYCYSSWCKFEWFSDSNCNDRVYTYPRLECSSECQQFYPKWELYTSAGDRYDSYSPHHTLFNK
eukprot:c21263_g1_i1.p1 GENE.c21263_g1_i1~~c21263_g1_i1.p1  ORF type:complete len:482 (+),score=120.70 c21263_g1_i1:44-1489(+)